MALLRERAWVRTVNTRVHMFESPDTGHGLRENLLIIA